MGEWKRGIALFLLSLSWCAWMGCGSSVAWLKRTPPSRLPSTHPPAPSSPSSGSSSSTPSTAPSSQGKATISKINVRSLPGLSRVVIEADRPVHASLFKASHPYTLFLDMDGVGFGFPEREAIEIYDGLIASVRPLYLDQRHTARVEVHLEREFSHQLEESGNRLILELKREDGSSVPGPIQASAEQASPPKPPEKLVEKKGGGPGEGMEAEEEEEEKETAVPKYSGRRISLDFQEADVNTILRIIAEVSGLNVITSGDVRGKVTIRLIDVPWDQALDIILKTSGYAMSREGNIIRVAPPALFQKEQQEILASRQTKEQVEELITQVYPINYATAEELQSHVTKLLSARGSITPDKRTNILIVKDLEKNLKEIRFLIDTLDKQTPQVAIHARILEVTKDFDREFGIIWSGESSSGHVLGNVSAPIGGKKVKNKDTQEIELTNPPAGIFHLDRISRNSPFQLDVTLQALETSRKLKVVSAPKITTLDNKEAVIKTGKSIPFSTSSAEGTKTELVDAVTELSVTPHITSDGYISMKIKASRNEPDTTLAVSGATSAGIDKREATTEVIVQDGDTLVIGGIFKKTDTTSNRAVPFLNRVPILGWLFRSDVLTDSNEELLIFITPYIVPGKPSA